MSVHKQSILILFDVCEVWVRRPSPITLVGGVWGGRGGG